MPQHLRLQARVHAPVERVFALFADHRRFATLFGGSAQRVREGHGDPDGIGSVRRVGPGPLSFDETIVGFEPNRRIEYTITRGSPLREHLGTIEFREDGGVTVVDYAIRFEGRFPGIGRLVAAALRTAWDRNSPQVLATLEH